MQYINDPKTKLLTYDEAVAAVIKAGIEPKRAYIYLASLGVRSEPARIKKADDYGYNRPVKMAWRNNDFIAEITKCNECGNLTLK